MEDRGAVVAVERHAGRAEALARTAARMGARSSRCAPPTPREPQEARRVRPRARRPAVLGPRARSRRGPTPAGASRPDCPRGSRELQGADPARGGGRAAARRHARVLHVHDLAGRERGAWCTAFLAERADFAADDLRCRLAGLAAWIASRCSCRRSPTATAPTGSSSRACAAGPRELRRHRSRRRLPGLRRAVAAAHEPARALPLRELPAPLRARVRVPQLRRALDDRADVEHRRCTRATTASASMLVPDL